MSESVVYWRYWDSIINIQYASRSHWKCKHLEQTKRSCLGQVSGIQQFPSQQSRESFNQILNLISFPHSLNYFIDSSSNLYFYSHDTIIICFLIFIAKIAEELIMHIIQHFILRNEAGKLFTKIYMSRISYFWLWLNSGSSYLLTIKTWRFLRFFSYWKMTSILR